MKIQKRGKQSRHLFFAPPLLHHTFQLIYSLNVVFEFFATSLDKISVLVADQPFRR